MNAAITCAALLLLVTNARAEEGDPLPARAGDFTLKLEPGVAVPLTDPQSDIFELGGGQTVKALWALNGILDIGPSVTYLALPSESALGDFGTAATFGGGVRIKRPHNAPDNDTFYAISPWVDADALYVRTGDLNRPGFAIGAGLSVPVGEARAFWVGPFARYLHILQGERNEFDSSDAKILSVGVSLEVGAGVRRERAVVAAAAPAALRTVTVNKEIFVCPDRDEDGVPDSVDQCPDVPGPLENRGCRVYKKLIINKDKLELTEKLYFAWDDSTLQAESFPVLDEVAQALNDNKEFRVQVEGHTSSEGTAEHNQTLSEKRAEAVLDYLAAHGVAKERLVSKGFSSSVPLDTNDTNVGRENNRRVEFVVYFIILKDGTK